MSKLPPVPPANRSPKGPGEPARDDGNAHEQQQVKREHLKEQGRQGNIAQNTTNQGYQQDR